MTGSHLTFRQVEDYAAKRLPPSEIPALHEHAETCHSCREMIEGVVVASGAEHLSEQQIVNFVAGLLPPAEKTSAAEHLERCASCKSMVADLEEFRQSDRPRRRNMPWLLPIAAALLAVAGTSVWFAVRPHSEPVAIAQLRDSNGMLRLTQADVLTGTAGLPPGSIGLMSSAMRSGHLPEGPPDLSAGPRETLRSTATAANPATAGIVSPDGVRVLSDRPEFRWQQPESAASWQVEVFDENFNRVARSGLLHATFWVPETPLPRMKPLLWQVTTIRHGVRVTAPAPPEPPARFEIVPEDAARRIAQAQAANPPSHLLLAILYRQVGLHQEATAEVNALATLNPGSALVSSFEKR